MTCVSAATTRRALLVLPFLLAAAIGGCALLPRRAVLVLGPALVSPVAVGMWCCAALAVVLVAGARRRVRERGEEPSALWLLAPVATLLGTGLVWGGATVAGGASPAATAAVVLVVLGAAATLAWRLRREPPERRRRHHAWAVTGLWAAVGGSSLGAALLAVPLLFGDAWYVLPSASAQGCQLVVHESIFFTTHGWVSVLPRGEVVPREVSEYDADTGSGAVGRGDYRLTWEGEQARLVVMPRADGRRQDGLTIRCSR